METLMKKNESEIFEDMITEKIISKLAALVEGDTKAPFSIATTPRCSEKCYSIPWIAPLYPWSLPYNVDKAESSTIFESLVWLDLGLNPGLLDHWRTFYSLGQWPGEKIIGTLKYIHKLKSPGIDKVTNFWLYYIPSTYQIMMKHAS